jgi:hypothetical protein
VGFLGFEVSRLGRLAAFSALTVACFAGGVFSIRSRVSSRLLRGFAMAKRRPVLTSKQWLTDKWSRELHDHYHALGVIENRWNIAEIQMQRLCWLLLGAGPERGRAATNEMGNVTLASFLRTLAAEIHNDPRTVSFATYAANIFNTNRDNRNFLTHCRVIAASNMKGLGVAILQRFQAKGKFNHTMYLAPIEILREIADEIEIWNKYATQFLDHVARVNSNAGPPFPDKPAMPRKIELRLQPFQPTQILPNPPSRRKAGSSRV